MNDQVATRKVIVVGGGPAGLIGAIAAAQRGAKVVLCEQLDRPGVKLLATGGGRCNLTNTLDPEPFMARFGRQGRFMSPALEAMDSRGLRDFFALLGVPSVVEADGFSVYPATHTAVSVQSALWRRCRELKVDVRLSARVTGLDIQPGDSGNESSLLSGVIADACPIAGDAVLLTTGGCGYRELGGGESGYALARQAGHSIVQPTPALVPLQTAEHWCSRCAGDAMSNARVRIDLPRRPKEGVVGEVMVTHRGLSGPAVLDISGEVAELLRDRRTVPLRVNLRAERSPGDWLAMFDRWRQQDGAKMLRTVLGRELSNRMAVVLIDLAGLPSDARCSQVVSTGRDELVRLLTDLPVSVIGTEGFARAMVTRGGVRLREVDPVRLASRVQPGLYLAGEVLDLAGPSGGFNLQWAFSSGHLAGMSAAEK